MSVQVSKKKQIVLGLIFLFIILGIVEAFAQIWLNEINTCAFETSEIYDHLDDIGKRILCNENFNLLFTDDRILIPQKILDQEGGLEYVNINNQGFRGHDFLAQKPEGVYRIIAVGGSTTLGTGVFDKQTYPYLLQEKFVEAGLNHVEVINAGLGKAWSGSETNLIKERLLDFDLDLLLVYDGWNDVKITHYTDEELQNIPLETRWKNTWTEICNIGNQNGYDTIVAVQSILGTSDRVLSDHEYEIMYAVLDQQIKYIRQLEFEKFVPVRTIPNFCLCSSRSVFSSIGRGNFSYWENIVFERSVPEKSAPGI